MKKLSQKKVLTAITLFLESVRTWVMLNEQEGIDSILNQYYADIQKIWETNKEEIRAIMARGKTREAMLYVYGKLGQEKIRKLTKDEIKKIFVKIASVVKERGQRAIRQAITLQFTKEALQELISKIRQNRQVVDDFTKSAFQRISNVFDVRYGTIGEYEKELSMLFGEVKRAEIARFNKAISGYVDDLLAGKIKTGEFHALMQKSIRKTYFETFTAGRSEYGGKGLEQAHLKWLEKEIKEEEKFLAGFVDDIKAGKVSDLQLKNRAKMYGDAIGSVYEKGKSSVFEEDPEVEIFWRLGIAEHCFPEGVKIAVVNGEKNIEDVRIGDKVMTLEGPKKVIKTYQRNYNGKLMNIRSGRLKIKCTPNHPFLTQRGWLFAKDLKKSDEVVIFQNGKDFIFRHLTFPNSDNFITTRLKIFVLSLISPLLSFLSFGKRFKTRMSMPIISISLNNQITDTNINYKFRLNQNTSFKFYLEFCKKLLQFKFQFSRFIFLQLLMSFKKFFKTINSFFRMVYIPLSNFFSNFWSPHRIIGKHKFFCFRMNNLISSFFGQTNMQSIGFISNLYRRSVQNLSYFFTSVSRIMCTKIFNFFWCPKVSLAFSTQAFSPIISIFSTFSTGSTFKSFLLSPKKGISTVSRAKAFILFVFNNLITKFTKFLFHCNNLFYQGIKRKSRIVYNLEIEDVHHYIANNFVVHNCNNCIALAAGSPYSVKKPLPTYPQQGDTVCLSNCKCFLVYKKGDKWNGEIG